jgi:hypothetical protein
MTVTRFIAALGMSMSMLMLKPLHLQGADSTEHEVRLLIDAIAASRCNFNRNGRQHTADEAAAHLELKYARAGRHVDSADEFITQLASSSSFTGRPYLMSCEGDTLPAEDWMIDALEQIRAHTQSLDQSTVSG